MEGVRAEGIGVRAGGGGREVEDWVGSAGHAGARVRWGGTSGLGGVGGRGRASTHGAISWYKSSVLNPTKKLILSFFGAGRGGPWSGATEARDGLAFGLGRSRG